VDPLHTNRVPLPAWVVTVAAGNPVGWSPAAPVITGDTVSVTTRFVIVAVPVFATTTRYVTELPVPGAAGVCVLSTDSPVRTGGITFPTTLLACVVSTAHEISPPMTNAVFDTDVVTHTSP